MKKKVLCLLLSVMMVFCMMPSAAFAGQIDTAGDFEGTVYVSYSHDGQFAQGTTDNGHMAYVAVDLADIAAIMDDDECFYDPNGDGVNDPVVYWLFKYCLMNYDSYGADDWTISGLGTGSAYMNSGAWHTDDGSPWDENLNYYFNGAYPLQYESMGATMDQITLHDGDFVDVMHFSNWSFWMDDNAGFQYFVGAKYLNDYNNGTVAKADENGTPGYVVHQFTATAGQPQEAGLVKAYGSLMIGGGTTYEALENTVYYGTDLYSVDGSWEAGSDGKFTMTFATPGDYWIWTEGTEGSEGDVVNAPAVAKVHVEAAPEPVNNIPTLAAGVEATAAATLTAGETYSVDLSTIFADADGDALTYTVGMNGGEAVAANAAYSFAPEEAGTYTLVFKANDGKADSEDTYTVTLTVNAPPAGTDPTYYWDSATDGTGWFAWSSSWIYMKTVFTEGVYVDSFEWDGATCNIVLAKTTTTDASFHFKTTAYARSSSGGVKINGSNAGSSSTDTVIELNDGTATVTVQPYYSSRMGTLKTFNFTIKDGGVVPQYNVELPSGTGYTTAPAEGYSTPVDSKADFGFVVNILEGYKKGQNFKVKANGVELTEGANSVYLIENIKTDQVVTVEDVVTADTVFYWNVNLPASPAGYAIAPEEGSASPVEEGHSYSFKVNILEGYAKNDQFAVKANDVTLTADANDVYTIENIQAHQTVTVTGVQDIYTVTLESGTGYTVDAEEGYTSPVFSGSNFKFKVNIAEGYKKGADFKVKSNGTELTPDGSDIYTITNIREAKTVTVEDVVTEDTVNQFRITLPETAGVVVAPVEGYSSPVDEGNDYKFTVTLEQGYVKNSSFAVKANGATLEADADGVYTIADIHDHYAITVTGVVQAATVTAPAGSTITAGTLSGSFKYTWYDPVETVTQRDGSVTSYFIPFSGTSFYRVQNPDGVTYWDFQSMTAGKTYTVTASDIKIDDDEFNKNTVYHDFVYNYLDLADVYLNINERNYLEMAPGGTREINAMRNWQAIESFTNSKIAIPDVHYEVIDENGNPSNLVTIVPDAHNTGMATVRAGDGTGMAIVRITYDAMIHKQGYASGYGAGGADSTRFSAIWPECTGVFVVTVGENGSGIDMGMTINTSGHVAHAGKVAGDRIDAEHDLLYYYDDEGATYSFKPEEGTTVTVARCTVGTVSLTYHGFTSEGVTTADDGTVTVTGLTAGRDIIKVEKDGVANYQVISARKGILTAKDSEGNVVDLSEKKFAPGETLTIDLDNINSPQEKLATCYNNSFSVSYYDETGTKVPVSNVAEHPYGQYNFSSLTKTLTVTIPADWDENTFTLTEGAIAMGGFSGCAAGGHRGKVSYGQSSGMATGTAGQGILSSLPDIVIKVKINSAPTLAEGVEETATASVAENATYGLDLTSIFTDVDGDELTYSVSVDGAEAVNAPAAYTYTPADNGKTAGDTVTLVFKANDGALDSTATYTVTLTVTETPLNVAENLKAVDSDCTLWPVYEQLIYDDVALYKELDMRPVYKVVIPSAKDLTIIEGTSFAALSESVEIYDGSGDTIAVTGGKYTIPTATLEAKKATVQSYCDEYGFSPSDFHMDGQTQVVLLMGDGYVDEDMAAEGMNGYYLFIAFDESATSDQVEHLWDEGVITSQSTFTEHGIMTYTCQNNPAHTKTEDIEKLLGFTVKVNGEEVTNITYTDKGFDASYEDWMTGAVIEDKVPLATVTLPSCNVESVEITLNDYWDKYQNYVYTKEPDATGYTSYIDYGFGDQVDTYNIVADADKAYTTSVLPEDQVYRVQTAYDANYVSYNLYAIAFEMADHQLEATPAKAATCEESGNTAYWTCTECGKYFEDAAGTKEIEYGSWVIPATGHDWDDGVITSQSTFTEHGIMTYTCKNNPAHTKTEEIEKLLGFTVKVNGEEITTITYTDKGFDASYEDWQTGAVIEDKVPLATVTLPSCNVESVEITLNDYWDKYQNYVYTKEPDSTGYTSYIDFGFGDQLDTYTIVADADKAYTTSVLPEDQVYRVQTAYDANYVSYNLYAIAFEMADHQLEATPAKPATCTEPGNTAYWTCTECGKYFEDAAGTKEIEKDSWVIAALGHDWDTENVVFNWADDYSTAEAVFTCKRDPEHVETVPATVTSEIAEGIITYTATAVFEGETYTDQKSEPMENTILRLSGKNRYDTSIAAAEHLKELNDGGKFDNIIVVSGLDFPDALSATYLAAVKEAPVLLVGKDAASIEKITGYVNDNLAENGTVYIVGGKVAVTEDVETALTGTVERLSGKDRYKTNLAVLEAASVEGADLLVACGSNYADALSASAAGRPILLVGNALTAEQAAYLDGNKDKLSGKAFIIGGKVAVSEDIEAEMANYAEEVKRLSGKNRYLTSEAVAKEFFPGEVSTVVIASGKNFPDGLAGGPVAVAYEAPLILVADGNFDHATAIFTEQHAYRLVVMGGKGVISKEIAETIAAPAKEAE